MKKMRVPLIIVFAVAIVGIILGSNFDLQLSQAIASANSVPGLLISVIGPTIGFSGLAVISGGFLALALQKGKPTWKTVLFWILAVASFGASVYYAGKEYFGENGFHKAAPAIVGYLIALVPLSGAGYLGYWLFKDNDNPNTWIVLVICCAVIGLTLIGAVTILKDIMHRPRYRSIVAAGIEYHDWWSPCKNYADLIRDHGLSKEEFKSYPSGHAGEISITLITLTFVPFVCPKMKKLQLPLFYGALAVVLLVCFGRILAAAHFLSDVSTGLAFAMLFAFIGNEIVIHIKRFHPEEAPKEE